MALKNQAINIAYVAWNTSTNQGQTGDAANHTLKLLQDGAEGVPTNAPSEADSTGMKGLYKLALTASDMNYNCVVLGGSSSTANVVIIPIVIVTERGVLPAVAPTNTGGFLTVGSGTGQINPNGGSVDAKTLAGKALTFDTNNYLNVNAQDINGAAATPVSILPANVTQWGGVNVGGMPLSLAALLNAPRAVDNQADNAFTVNDALWGASIAGFGKDDISNGTQRVRRTPAGTALRTFTVSTSPTNPYGANYPVTIA